MTLLGIQPKREAIGLADGHPLSRLIGTHFGSNPDDEGVQKPVSRVVNI